MIKARAIKVRQSIKTLKILLESLNDRGVLKELSPPDAIIFSRLDGMDEHRLVWSFWMRNKENYLRELKLISEKEMRFETGDERYDANKELIEKVGSEIRRVKQSPGIRQALQLKATEVLPGTVAIDFWYVGSAAENFLSDSDHTLNRLIRYINTEINGSQPSSGETPEPDSPATTAIGEKVNVDTTPTTEQREPRRDISERRSRVAEWWRENELTINQMALRAHVSEATIKRDLRALGLSTRKKRNNKI